MFCRFVALMKMDGIMNFAKFQDIMLLLPDCSLLACVGLSHTNIAVGNLKGFHK